MAVKRVKSGIPGFDDIVFGGIPQGNSVIVTGAPGTGKSIFAMQFLNQGAQNGEPGVYISFEQSADEVKEQAQQFGWNFEDLEKKDKLRVHAIPIDRLTIDVFTEIEAIANEVKAKRVVIDSLAVFAVNYEMYSIPLSVATEQMEAQYRSIKHQDVTPTSITGKTNTKDRLIYLFLRKLKNLGATSLVITDAPQDGSQITRDGVSEFACDGVIQLHSYEREDSMYTLNINKMRMTKHKRGIYSFDINEQGVIIKE